MPNSIVYKYSAVSTCLLFEQTWQKIRFPKIDYILICDDDSLIGHNRKIWYHVYGILCIVILFMIVQIAKKTYFLLYRVN